MVSKRININLTDKEDQFIKWLAKRDDTSYQKELQIIFQMELDHEMEIYRDEMLADQEGVEK